MLRIRSGLFIIFCMSGMFIISLIKFGFSANCCCIWSSSGRPEPNKPNPPLLAAPVAPRPCNKPPKPGAGELAGVVAEASWLAAGAVVAGGGAAPRTM
uniref:Uncharacterized protein n=1 Tax=Arundo donax TaxID=35708 RepID=A0A0A9AM72_ARUDO